MPHTITPGTSSFDRRDQQTRSSRLDKLSHRQMMALTTVVVLLSGTACLMAAYFTVVILGFLSMLALQDLVSHLRLVVVAGSFVIMMVMLCTSSRLERSERLIGNAAVGGFVGVLIANLLV